MAHHGYLPTICEEELEKVENTMIHDWRLSASIDDHDDSVSDWSPNTSSPSGSDHDLPKQVPSMAPHEKTASQRTLPGRGHHAEQADARKPPWMNSTPDPTVHYHTLMLTSGQDSDSGHQRRRQSFDLAVSLEMSRRSLSAVRADRGGESAVRVEIGEQLQRLDWAKQMIVQYASECGEYCFQPHRANLATNV